MSKEAVEDETVAPTRRGPQTTCLYRPMCSLLVLLVWTHPNSAVEEREPRTASVQKDEHETKLEAPFGEET